MTLGLASKQRLHEAVNGDVPTLPPMTDDEAHYFRHGKASDKLKQEEITFPDRPFMPNYSALGTPGEFERARAMRLAVVHAKWASICIALILALVALSAYNTFAAPRQREIVRGDDIYYGQRAARLATARSIYVNDPHEGCLVGMHKTQAGNVVVSTHC